MEPSIKQYADALFEKALTESAASSRHDCTTYLVERSKVQDSGLFSGIDFQAISRIYAQHVERSTAARLDSYHKAFGETGRQPTEAEFTEILNDFKATWETQIRNASQALSNFLAGRGAPAGVDLSEMLRATSAHGHDHVLQEWKIWRSRALLQKSVSASEAVTRSVPLVGSPHLGAQANEPGTGAPVAGKYKRAGISRSAFISYSWDSDTHRDWVRTLAERLRADGVDVSIDRWETVPGDQLTSFMERAIRENQFVVIICTPRYKVRSDAREGGVGYEGDIMTAEVMASQNNRKFIPVLRSGTWAEAAPSWLLGKYYINLAGDPYSERDYEDLVRTLLAIREDPPPIGKPMSTITPSASAAPRSSTAGVTTGFDDIKITRVIVEDITEPRNDGTTGSALYSIPFALSAAPSSEWSSLFVQNWNHPSRFTTMHRPGIASVHGSIVVLDGTTVEEVERYHRDTLQLAVADTNRQYREWLHKQEQDRASEEYMRAEHRKRVEEASKRIKFD